MTPEVMAWDGLKPHTASQSPCRAPAYRCLLAGPTFEGLPLSMGVRTWPGEIPGGCRWPATPDGRHRPFGGEPV